MNPVSFIETGFYDVKSLMEKRVLTTELNPNEINLDGISVVVIGEMHGSASDYEFQYNLINRYEPDIILNELAINLVLDNMTKKKTLSRNSKKG